MPSENPIDWAVAGTSSLVTGVVASALSQPYQCTESNIFTGEAGHCENILGFAPIFLNSGEALFLSVALALVVGAAVAVWRWFVQQQRQPPTPTP